MTGSGFSRLTRLAWAAPIFGLLGLGLVAATPVAAQSSTCGSGVQVWMLGLSQNQNGHQGIIMQPVANSGGFSGTFQVQVVCAGPNGNQPVTGATVDICAVLANPVTNATLRVSGVGFDPSGAQSSVNSPSQVANCSIDTATGTVSGQAAAISVPYGYANVTIDTAYPLDPNSTFAFIGRQAVILTSAYGGSLLTGTGTGTGGQPTNTYAGSPAFSPGVWAQTPELDSIALFGSGALGLVGYGLMRLRAARKRDDA
ncbi:MAG: hypothetical protein JO020_06595 [Chloroflexi bacterium]|nr:hypothetical protein [Chloroflexota bacterium]